MASYQALYRTWRPLTFDTVVGQAHVTQTLKNEIRMNRIAHAYLFCGSRGTGKTSTARIFSRAVNCENPKDGNPCNECATCKGILDGTILDVIEIDAASNNGVDNIRSMREEAQYSAAAAPYKIYIIDEVHMLSGGAFNALLKLLEEPPEHVIFILATTESQKVPATILSRCQRFDFHRITVPDIVARLAEICERSNIPAEREALHLIAEEADGAMRDALSILDQCLSVGEATVSYADVAAFLGATDHRFLIGILKAVSEQNPKDALSLIDEFMAAGKNPVLLMENLMETLRSLLLCKTMEHPESILEVSADYAAQLQALAEDFTNESILHGMTRLSECMNAAKYMKNPRVLVEMAVTKMCLPSYAEDTEALAARVAEMEKAIRRGVVPAKEAAKEAPKAEEVREPAPSPKEEEAPKKQEKKTEKPLSERLKTIQNSWQEVLLELLGTDDLMLQMALPQGKLYAADEEIMLVFDTPFFVEQVKPHKKEIEAKILEITGLTEHILLQSKDQLKKRKDEVDHLVELIQSGDPIVE